MHHLAARRRRFFPTAYARRELIFKATRIQSRWLCNSYFAQVRVCRYSITNFQLSTRSDLHLLALICSEKIYAESTRFSLQTDMEFSSSSSGRPRILTRCTGIKVVIAVSNTGASVPMICLAVIGSSLHGLSVPTSRHDGAHDLRHVRVRDPGDFEFQTQKGVG